MLEDLSLSQSTLRALNPIPPGGAEGVAEVQQQERLLKDLLGDPGGPRYAREEQEIGRGGQAGVFCVEELLLKRRIAKKVLPVLPEQETAGVDTERFVREARLTAQLEHPNIVPVYELGEEVVEAGVDATRHPSGQKRRLFYTMKRVKGRTLHEVVKAVENNREDLDLRALLTIFQKVCDAVAFAHSRGVIHCDLKPRNIMVGEFGEVLVMDWGMAKVVGEKADEAMLGTAGFVSPERARGDLEEVDERSDIYALGGVLHQVLTLRPPVELDAEDHRQLERFFEVERQTKVSELLRQKADAGGEAKLDADAIQQLEESLKTGRQAWILDRLLEKTVQGKVALAMKHERGRLRAAHCSGGRVPEALAAVVLRALSLEKNERYPSVLALQEEIRSFLGGVATRAENAGVWRRAVYFFGRYKSASAAVASALMLTTVSSALFSRKVMGERDAKDVALAHLALTNRRLSDQTALALANEKKALQNADEAQKEKDRAETEAGRKTRAFKALSLAEVQANWEFALKALGKREPSLAVAHLVNVLRVDPSHQLSGRMLIGILSETVFPRWKCRPWCALDSLKKNEGETMFEDSFRAEVEDIQLSPDGTRALAILYGGGCYLVDATSGRTLWSQQVARDIDPEEVARYVFSEDGKYVLGVAKGAGKTKQAVHRLVSSVQASDGTILPDVHALARTRQAEISAIGKEVSPSRLGPLSAKKTRRNGVQITAKGISIKGDEDNVYRIPTLERVENYWLSPNKKWFCFNGIAPETFDGGELGLSTGWTYKFGLESVPESVKADLNYYQLVTFDSGSRFMTKNMWVSGYEGPGLAEVDRLSTQSDPLELPVEGEKHRAVIGASNVLAVSSMGGLVSFFDIPEAPLGVNALPVAPTAGDAELVWKEDPEALDENEKRWANSIFSSCGTGADFWKRKRPAVFTTRSHDQMVMVFDDQVCVVGEANAEVRCWKLPDGMGLSKKDFRTQIREALRVFKTEERTCVIARIQPGNGGTKILFAAFNDHDGPPLVQAFNLSRVDSSDCRVVWLKSGEQFIVLTPNEFLVLNAANLSEAGRCRFDNRDLSVFSHLENPMDLLPNEDFLRWVEYVGGWRFNARGQYEPVGYSEELSIQSKRSGSVRNQKP